jgi:ankyrin repeat protein
MKNNSILFIFIISFSNLMSMEFSHLIQEAGKKADISLAQHLLQRGMNINEKGKLGYSMLLHGISNVHEKFMPKIPVRKRLEFIEFLIKSGAELNPKTDNWMEMPLLAATFSEIAPDIMELFVKYGVDINMQHQGHGSVLHLAAWNGRHNLVKFLVKQPTIKVDVTDTDGETPLMKAAFWGYAKVIKILAKHGADVTKKDNANRTALDYALKCSRSEKYRNRIKTIKNLLRYDRDNVLVKRLVNIVDPIQ